MLRRLRFLWRNLFSSDETAKILDDEIASSVEILTAERVEGGMDPAEARRQALIEIGGVEQVKLLVREATMGSMVQNVLQDVSYGLRLLAKSPGFTAAAVLTLALGIGANTAIFSILDAVLLEELPYNDPGRLYMLRSMDSNGLPTGRMAHRFARPFYEDHALVEAAAIGFGLSGSVIDSEQTAYPFLAYYVTPRFFDVFDNPMALGRRFEPNEAEDSVIISHATWRDRFGSDPGILGMLITVNNAPLQVVGVAGEGFSFPEGAGSWQPIYLEPEYDDLINFDGYLRLRPGVTPDSFEAVLAAMSGELGPNAETGEPLDYALVPLLDDVVGDLGSTVLILSGATLILLLIACLNVANLLFARGNARAREIGLRAALGARGGRIVRQLLTESLLLSAIGGTLGIALAIAGGRVLLGLGPGNLPRLDTVGIDTNVLVFSVGVIVVTSMLVGLAPAIRLSRAGVRSLVAPGVRGASPGRQENRLFGGLVIAEVGLSVVLVIGAGLLVRSYVNLATTDPGFDPSQILAVRLNATHIEADVQVVEGPNGEILEYRGTGFQPVIDFYHALMDRIRELPGVVEVAGGQELPLHPNPTQASTEPFRIVGYPDTEYQVRIRPVSANFFDTLGASIVEGRGIGLDDRRGTPGVAVVNEAFARRYFPNDDPIGQRLDLPSADFRLPATPNEAAGRGYGFGERIYDTVEIVGVVSDVRFARLYEPPPPYLFMSTDQFTPRMRNLAVKTNLDDPETLVDAIRREIAGMAPTVPVEFAVYEEVVDASIARQRMGMALLSVFAGIALVLAAVGIYGVMAYSVSERTGEIAVRAALGASRGQVLGLVIRRAVILSLAGVALGVLGAVALRQVIAGQLHGVSALDPAVLLLVPVLLFGIALAASFLPARRAARIDPAVGLRHG